MFWVASPWVHCAFGQAFKYDFTYLGDGILAADKPNKHSDYRKDQKQVDEPTKSIRGHETEEPEDDEQNGDGQQHNDFLNVKTALLPAT